MAPLARLWRSSVLFGLILLAAALHAGDRAQPLKAALGQLLVADEGTVEVLPPIDISPKAKLTKDFIAEHHRWAQRVLLAPLAVHAAKAAWAQDAVAFAEQAVDDLCEPFEPKQAESVAAQGQKVLEAGCQDPFVRYLTARIAYRQTKDAPATTKVFDEVTKQVGKDRSYGAALLNFVSRDAFVVRRVAGGQPRGVEKGMADLVKKELTDGSYGKEDAAIFVFHQIGAQWDDMTDAYPTAVFEAYADGTLPEWARLSLRGHCEIKLAWQARGNGWGNEVTEKGFAGFSEHLAKAVEELTEAWKQRPDQPYAANDMITVAMAGAAQEEEAVRVWFDRAVAARFDYEPAYRAVLWAYRPRWGGSSELMLGFGRICRDTRRFDTKVPVFFRQAVFDVLTEVGDKREYLRAHPALVRELMALDRDLIKQPGPNGPADLWRMKLAVDAWCIGDFKAAREALAQVPNGLALVASNTLRELRTTPREVLTDVALAGTPAEKLRDQAEQAYQRGDLPAARDGFAKAEAQAQGEAASWLHGRVNVMDFEREFAKGDWVKVRGEVGSDWLAVQGQYRNEPDGSIASVSDNGYGLLIYRGHVGANFELRGSFEVQSPKHEWQNFGVVVGYQEPHGGGWLNCSIYQDAGRQLTFSPLRMHYGFVLPKDVRKAVTLEEGANRFYLRNENGKVSYELNDRPLLEQFTVPDGQSGPTDLPVGQFGFSSAKNASGVTIRIIEVEVRRITPTPAK